MKTVLAGLQNSIQSTYSNNGKTTIFGRAFQKSINSQNVIGPQLTQWLDLFQTYALYPQEVYYNPNTGHLFVLSSTAVALTAINMYVQLFNFSAATNWVPSYVGRVNLNFGNSAASARACRGTDGTKYGVTLNDGINEPRRLQIRGFCLTFDKTRFLIHTMKFKVQFPMSDSLQPSQKMDSPKNRLLSKFIQFQENVTVEFDTKTRTAKVLPIKNSEVNP